MHSTTTVYSAAIVLKRNLYMRNYILYIFIKIFYKFNVKDQVYTNLGLQIKILCFFFWIKQINKGGRPAIIVAKEIKCGWVGNLLFRLFALRSKSLILKSCRDYFAHVALYKRATVSHLLMSRVSPNFASKRNRSETKRNFLQRNSETDPLVLLVSLWSKTGI